MYWLFQSDERETGRNVFSVETYLELEHNKTLAKHDLLLYKISIKTR